MNNGNLKIFATNSTIGLFGHIRQIYTNYSISEVVCESAIFPSIDK